MKKGIHPNYYHDAQVTCACGNKFTTGSTLEEIKVEICAACHPFFTGEMKYVDTAGRVDKFKEKMAVSQSSNYIKKRDKKRAKKEAERAALQAAPQTMKEMMSQARTDLKKQQKSEKSDDSQQTTSKSVQDGQSSDQDDKDKKKED